MDQQIYDFGLRIRALRKGMGLSQAELSRKLHLTRATISGYESNTKTPSVTVLISMAQFFNVSTDYLLGIKQGTALNINGLPDPTVGAINNLIHTLTDKKHDIE